MSRALIPDFEPHTPTNLPDMRPTCSRPSEDNKGCDAYNYCRLPVKGQNRGPVQVVIEDYRGTEPGSGRRFCTWCYWAFRRYFGAKPVAEFRMCPDGIHPEQRPDGSWIAAKMPAPEQQGPYPFAPTANPNRDAADVVSRALKGDFSPSTPAAKRPPVDAAEIKRMAAAAGLPLSETGTGYVPPEPIPEPTLPPPDAAPVATEPAPAAAPDGSGIADAGLNRLQSRLRRNHGD